MSRRGLAAVFVGAVFCAAMYVPVAASPSDAEKCAAAKMKAAGKYAACRLKADAKAETLMLTPDYSKCDAKQLGRWTAIESRYGAGCPTSGDQADVQTTVSDLTTCLASDLAGTPTNCDLATLQTELATCNNDLATCRGLPCNTNLPGPCSAGTTGCAGGVVSCNPNIQPETEVCNGLDDDCDGMADDGNPGGGAACNTGLMGVCAPGTTVCASGAMSCQQNVSPSAEVCDGLDNNCDGVIDEGVRNTYYRDADNDMYGSAVLTTQACAAPSGYVANGTDCDDGNSAIHPGATEICNGVDDNCVAGIDEGC